MFIQLAEKIRLNFGEFLPDLRLHLYKGGRSSKTTEIGQRLLKAGFENYGFVRCTEWASGAEYARLLAGKCRPRWQALRG